MQAYALIIAFFAAGIIANYGVKLSSDTKSTLTRLSNLWIIRVAIIAIIFLNVPNLNITVSALVPTAVAWGWLLLSACLVLMAGRILQLRRDIIGSMLLLVPLGNTSFIGYPMVLAFFDSEVLGFALFYDQLGSFIALATYATIVLAIYTSTDGEEQSVINWQTWRKIAYKVATFPPLLALLLALLLPLDSLVDNTRPLLELLGASLMPLALFTLGLQFQPTLVKEQVSPLCLSIAFKMLLAPILVYWVLSAFALPEKVFQASVFESAMPMMMTPGILAIQAGLAPRFTATLLGYSTLFSMVSLPVWAFLLGAFSMAETV